MPIARMTVWRGDITSLAVDAIVNAANESLLGGGGVDGAIHRAARPGLLKKCKSLGGCAPGDAKITGGYDLPARHVIHTVGPVWRDGGHGETQLLASCYRRALLVAQEAACATVAFPAISTGVYGYPPDTAAEIAVGTVAETLARTPGITQVVFCCFGAESAALHEAAPARLGDG